MSYTENNKPNTKIWAVRDGNVTAPTEAVDAIASGLNITKTTARLLADRGFTTPEAAKNFITLSEELMHDPFLIADMDKAIARIEAAIAAKEKIMIYGDYDVDGVTSVSILYLYLASRGCEVYYYIPNRAGEGYGMSAAAIEKMASDGIKLIVTVDTGITANEEIDRAAELGVEVLVTDHHECHGTPPNAVAVVNPRRPDCAYPFKSLAGVGVVFKLLCALELRFRKGQEEEIDSIRRICAEYADLVALGTVADVMPIVDENRLIVSYGLKLIEKRQRLGVSALIDASVQRQDAKPVNGYTPKPKNPKITSGFIGYTIAPRINAAGRISSASIAVELFLTDSKEKAAQLASELCEVNRFRQSEENKIAEEAYEKIKNEHDFEHNPVIVLEDDKWHHGVIGIVASRITEKYGLPSILISFEGEGNDEPLGTDVGKGSGRSIKGLNLVDALVHCNDLLVKYGGHELAAGLCIKRENIEAFKERINAYAREAFSADGVSPSTVDYDFEITGDELVMDFADELRLLEPYGVMNPIPSFVMHDCEITDIVPISAGKHTKLVIQNGERTVVAMCFSRTQADLNVFRGEKIDILFNVDINEYNGNKTVQLVARDVLPSTAAAKRADAEKARFEEIKSGAAITAEEDVVPNRNDFAHVYTMITRDVRMGFDTTTHRALMAKLADDGIKINYIKLKFIIMVFRELNIIGIEEPEDETYIFKVYNTNAKTDLEKSGLLRKLRAAQYKQG